MLFFETNIKASGNNFSKLEFKLNNVVEVGNIKILKIEATNNSKSTEYSIGWSNSCDLIVETTKGTYKHNVISHVLQQGTKEFTYMLKAPGEIKSIRYNKILELSSNGLPPSEMVEHWLKAEMDVNIDNYNQFNAVPTIIIAAVLTVAFIIMMILIGRSKKGRIICKTVGITIGIIGGATLLYAFYLFVLKPMYKQVDIIDIVTEYWFLWIIGFIALILGIIICKCQY